MKDNEPNKPKLDTPTERVPVTKFEPCPYSSEASNAILDKARAEYEKLAAKKAYDDRVKNGIGLPWQQVIHINS